MILLYTCPFCNGCSFSISKYTSITNDEIAAYRCVTNTYSNMFVITFRNNKLDSINFKKNNKGFRVDYERNRIQYYPNNSEFIDMYDTTKISSIDDLIFL